MLFPAVYAAVTCVALMLTSVKTMTCFCSCTNSRDHEAKQAYTGTPDRSIPVNNHRRKWIENRIRILSSLFAIDICSYCVMSNHIHIVIKLMPQEPESWTDNEVLEGWTHLYTGPRAIQQWSANTLDNPADYENLNGLVFKACLSFIVTESEGFF
ncbi:MAG: hypothetical protein ACI8XX_001914 [Polaribacter sp.]|jgi:hypothetical protein